MGRMKEHLNDVTDYAENCCGFSASVEEAWHTFDSMYPGNEELFDEAWRNWLSFSGYILQSEPELS